MRQLVMMMAACLTAACSESPVTNSEDTEAGKVATTANGSPPGTYYVAGPDGTASLVTLYADGAYSQITPEGEYPSQGTFEVLDGKTCFKVHQIGAELNCYTESPLNEDGSYTATLDSGDVLTVTPYTAEDVNVAG